MAIFVALGTATESGRSRTLEGLAERHARAVARAEDAGAQVLASYALLGPYDYLTLLDAPDIETVARVLIREAARGNVHYEIHPALPMEQFARLVGEEEVMKPHRVARTRAPRKTQQADSPDQEGAHRVRRQGGGRQADESKESG
jgi:uncharacterized protein with GYD domain